MSETAIQRLQREFRASLDHDDIKRNRALIQQAAAEANATLRLVQSLAETNRRNCDHKDARWYNDRSGTPERDCPHCGG